MGGNSSVVLWRDIYQIAEKVCAHFNLRFGKILPETRKQARCYGETYSCERCTNNPNIDSRNCTEKILRIRLHQLSGKRKPLSSSTIIRTLAHELAHLREWDHGSAHKKFENEILLYIRKMGYKI